MSGFRVGVRFRVSVSLVREVSPSMFIASNVIIHVRVCIHDILYTNMYTRFTFIASNVKLDIHRNIYI